MQYIVLERKVYERYSVVDADDPEEAKEILGIAQTPRCVAYVQQQVLSQKRDNLFYYNNI